jgi:DNA polymerase-3 subunit alpha
MKIPQTIREWMQANNLNAAYKKGGIVVVGGKRFFYVAAKRDKVVSKELNVILSPDERKLIRKAKPDFVLYEFGGRVYHSPLPENFYKQRVPIAATFSDTKYIGTPNRSLEVPFCHLGVHSEYELMNGSGVAKRWVEKAKFLGHTGLGCADKNTLAGAIAFQDACTKAEIKPVFGETISVRYRNGVIHELKLYVLNKQGWQNLLRINKAINVDNHEDQCIDERELLRRGKGLVVVFPVDSILSYSGDLASMKIVKRYSKFFDKAFYQIDVTEYKSDKDDKKLLEHVKKFVRMLDGFIEPILISDSYYVDREEAAVKDYLNKAARVSWPESDEFHFKSLIEIYEKLVPNFKDEEDWLDLFLRSAENSMWLQEQADFLIDVGHHKLPKFELLSRSECLGDEEVYQKTLPKVWADYGLEIGDNEGLFYHLLAEGVKKKLEHLKEKELEAYYERLEIEMDVIVPAGFVDYFLILWDIIAWAKESGIYVGNARGSVAGSLVAFLLDITTVDPIKFDLLFERFLNKTRVSGERAKAADALPDIDVDFEAARRDDVKEYMRRKYGHDYVCSIGAYDRLKVKSALKDFARVEGMAFQYVNTITGKIENQLKWSWGDLFKYTTDPMLWSFVQKNGHLVNTMKSTMNQASNSTIHASAVIIVPKEDADGNPMEIYDWMPVKLMPGNTGQKILVSEWEGKYIDRAGFLKEDILGLSQLDKFHTICDLIEDYYGKRIVLEDIDLNDPDVLAEYAKGHVEDVFQFSGDGIRSFSKDVQPYDVEHIIAMSALYRPGPMSSNAHNHFAEILNGKREPEYDYGLEKVTAKTHGLYIYQEQIMQAVHVLGGLTLSEADQLRTAIKKFDKAKMDSFKQKFIGGAIERGCSKKEAARIWNKLEKFSSYGFNRSHAAAYSIMSYWSMWLKTYYPLAFYTASLQHSNDGSVPYRIKEMNRMRPDISINPPDINMSTRFFQGSVADNAIFWSFIKVKGIGDKAAEKIIGERTENGDFTSVKQFIQRMQGTGLGRDKTAALIFAGAFDKIHKCETEVDRFVVYRKYCEEYKMKIEGEFAAEYAKTRQFWVMKQRAVTGMGNLDFKSLLKKKSVKMAKHFYTGAAFEALRLKGAKRATKLAVVVGNINWLAKMKKKKDQTEFCRVEVVSNNDTISVMFWTEEWAKYKAEVEKAYKDGNIVAFAGLAGYDDFRKSNMLFTNNDYYKMLVL